MNIICVEPAAEFRGDDVVLLAMDGAGLGSFLHALRDAEQRGSSLLEHDGVTHHFVTEVGGARYRTGRKSCGMAA